MKITNRMNLPESIVRAVINDTYTKGDADFSVTELINPPQLVRLLKQYEDQITEDVADRIWSLLGQCMHVVIERAGGSLADVLSEVTIYSDFNGQKLKGTIDHVTLSNRHLRDYKLTSVWKMLGGGCPPEWEAQTNTYRYMLRREKAFDIDAISIIAFFRDWSKREAARNPDYPQAQVLQVSVPLWSYDQAYAYVTERLALHSQTSVTPCTDADIWAKPDKWALMKRGQKRAIRLYSTLEEAEAAQTVSTTIEHRPGIATRCQSYCPVAQFCPQWAVDPRNVPTAAEELFA